MPTFARLRPSILILGLSLISFAVAIFIGIRLFGQVDRMGPPVPRQNDVTLIQPWMSLPYVSKVYGVPMSVFDVALDLNKKNHFESLENIAKKKGKKTADLISQIQTIITVFQLEHTGPRSQ